MTYVLYMILFVAHGNASYGGPLVLDVFKTEEACVAFADKIIKATPKVIETSVPLFNQKPDIKVVECIKK